MIDATAGSSAHGRTTARPMTRADRQQCPSATTTRRSGVTRTASDGELKTAFRKLAMQCHPDRNPGDKEAEIKFKEINEAYRRPHGRAEARRL